MKKIIILTESQSKRLIESLSNSPELLIEFKSNLTFNDLDYESMVDFLGNRDSRKVGNNTWIERVDDFIIGYKLHGTYIVKNSPTNIIKLNTNGWETNTTQSRLNYLLRRIGVSISVKRGIWYISDRDKTYEYFDGIKINLNDRRIIPPEEWEGFGGSIVKGYRN